MDRLGIVTVFSPWLRILCLPMEDNVRSVASPSGSNALECCASVWAAISFKVIPPILLTVPVKYASMTSLRNADRLENLAALIGLNRGNAHLGRNLYDALQNRMVIIFYCRIIILVQQTVFYQLCDGGMGQIRVDRARTVA